MAKTVFDYFSDFAIGLGINPTDEKNRDCFQGIKDYLKEIELDDDTRDDLAKIAKRELLRFKYINQESFERFFIHYQDRSRLSNISRKIDRRAMLCIKTGVNCDPIEVRSLTEAFYKAAMPLAADPRYKGWIDERIDNVVMSLDNLRGFSDKINADVAKYLAMDQIDPPTD
jgi:hypothetical protein